MSYWGVTERTLRTWNHRYGFLEKPAKNVYRIPKQIITGRAISDPSVEFTETWPRPEEIVQLQHADRDEDVEVQNCKDIPTRDVRAYRVTRVISPFLFYTEYDVNYRHNGFRHWRQSFQAYYDLPLNDRQLRLTTKHVKKFRCYAHKDPQTNEWERVRVFRQNHKFRLAEVFLCDYASFKIVRFEDLRELKPIFTTWSAQGFRMHLIHIQPVGGGMIWPKKAVDYFKSLLVKKTFNTVVMTRSESRMPDGFPDYVQDFGVFMIPSDRGMRTIQAEMVRAGFAEATGMAAGYPEILEDPKWTPTFDIDDLALTPPSMLISSDIQPPPRIPSAAEAANYIRVAKQEIANIKKKSGRGQMNLLARLTRRAEIICAERLKLEHMPYGLQCKLGYVKVSHISNPGLAFIQVQAQIPKLEEMETTIGILCSANPSVSKGDNRVGIMIATYYQTDKTRHPSWVRCIVVDVVDTESGTDVIKIFLIDYGILLSMKREFCRYLPDYFKTIPSFAHRVHLDFGTVIPAGTKMWSSDASEMFRKYIMSWESQEPLYYIWSRPDMKRIELEDMHQIIQYNIVENVWEAGSIRTSSRAHINFKDVPILKPLYSSIGVEMVFEVLQKSHSYLFQYLTHVLIEGGCCLERKPAVGLPMKHKAIVKAMNAANIYQGQLAVLMDEEGCYSY